MIKTTDFKAILETDFEGSEKLLSNINLTITDQSKIMRPDRLLGQVKEMVAMELRRYNLINYEKLITGEGNNHIWISKEKTGERVILITYKIVHRMNLQV